MWVRVGTWIVRELFQPPGDTCNVNIELTEENAEGGGMETRGSSDVRSILILTSKEADDAVHVMN